MATNLDSFTITAGMLAYAAPKAATVYYPGGAAVAGKTNSTDNYLPKLDAEKAGAPGGVSAAVSADPNYVFARTMKAGLEKTPYVTGSPGDVTQSDLVAPIECNATLSVPNI